MSRAQARAALDVLLDKLREYGRREIDVGNNFVMEWNQIDRYVTLHSGLFADGIAAAYNPHGPARIVLTFAGFPYTDSARPGRARRRRRRP